jgi:hypothetical protein
MTQITSKKSLPLLATLLSSSLLWPSLAAAQGLQAEASSAGIDASATGLPADAPPKPPPYSLPWQLRPVAPGNVVRSDTAFALWETPTGDSGSTVATTLLASYKVLPNLAPLVRLGLVANSPPDAPAPAPESGTSFMNPVIGALYAPELPKPLKLGLFLGAALPFGTGGGDDPEPEQVAANTAGIWARSAMDNAMFAVNYFVVFPGVDFAYVEDGLTLQAEVTVLQLIKTRGPEAADDKNTNFTAGFHAGYFLIPELSIGAELRHQRWLSTPTPVETNDALRETTTVAVGPRVHLKLGETTWLRPGVSFALPLDEPMTDGKYKVIQLDIPFAF